MRLPTAAELLDIWEHGRNQTLMQKSLSLLAVACSISIKNAAILSIGERDARLLQLRKWMFGSRLVSTATCAECTGLVEWENKVEDLQLQKIDPEGAVKIYELQQDNYQIRFRLPNTDDIITALHSNNRHHSQKIIFSQCIFEVQSEHKEDHADTLPDAILQLISKRMAAEDPQADIRIVLNCPYCNHQWEAPFNIVNYLWVEIDTWARRILQEVCLLAKAFSWSENDILQMTPYRRNLYLEMIKQ